MKLQDITITLYAKYRFSDTARWREVSGTIGGDGNLYIHEFPGVSTEDFDYKCIEDVNLYIKTPEYALEIEE